MTPIDWLLSGDTGISSECICGVPSQVANLCTWEADEDGIWHAACDHTSQNLYCFTEGGPGDNGFKFCPFCGRPLVEVKSIPASE